MAYSSIYTHERLRHIKKKHKNYGLKHHLRFFFCRTLTMFLRVYFQVHALFQCYMVLFDENKVIIILLFCTNTGNGTNIIISMHGMFVV